MLKFIVGSTAIIVFLGTASMTWGYFSNSSHSPDAVWWLLGGWAVSIAYALYIKNES